MSAPGARPRVAFFTPLPPVESGISQYSAELLPLLAERLDLTIFVDGYRPAITMPGVEIAPGKQFERRQAARPFDLAIYQMGNSPAHAYMWELARRRPGLLVLHDVVLHHLAVWMAVNRNGVREYRREMAARYGPAGAEAALRTLRGQMPGGVFDYPLCERLVEASRAVAVHSAYAAERVAERCGRRPAVVPMGVPLYRLPERAAARRRLGLPADAPVIASLTALTPHKRIDVVLRSLTRVRAAFSEALFVAAGSESPGLNLRRQARMLGLEEMIRHLGYIPEASVPDLLAAADVVVNLRYPTAGETSASLLRILAAGKAVVVSRAGSMAETPPAACAQIPPDAIEEDLLAETLTRLLADERLREQMGRNARSFIEARHTLVHAANAYLAMIGELLGRPLEPLTQAPPVVDARAGGPPLATAPAPAAPLTPSPLADAVAEALVGLGLDRAPGLRRAAARALAGLGLGSPLDKPGGR